MAISSSSFIFPLNFSVETQAKNSLIGVLKIGVLNLMATSVSYNFTIFVILLVCSLFLFNDSNPRRAIWGYGLAWFSGFSKCSNNCLVNYDRLLVIVAISPALQLNNKLNYPKSLLSVMILVFDSICTRQQSNQPNTVTHAFRESFLNLASIGKNPFFSPKTKYVSISVPLKVQPWADTYTRIHILLFLSFLISDI